MGHAIGQQSTHERLLAADNHITCRKREASTTPECPATTASALPGGAPLCHPSADGWPTASLCEETRWPRSLARGIIPANSVSSRERGRRARGRISARQITSTERVARRRCVAVTTVPSSKNLSLRLSKLDIEAGALAGKNNLFQSKHISLTQKESQTPSLPWSSYLSNKQNSSGA